MRRAVATLSASGVVLVAALVYAQVPVSPETAAAAGSSLIKDTALGAFAIICLCLAVWAILQLKKVQDSRVTDKEKSADRLEAANDKDRIAQGELTKAVNALATSNSEQAKAIERNTAAIQENTRSVETVIRDALRSRGTGGSGGYPATRPREPARDPRREGE